MLLKRGHCDGARCKIGVRVFVLANICNATLCCRPSVMISFAVCCCVFNALCTIKRYPWTSVHVRPFMWVSSQTRIPMRRLGAAQDERLSGT